MARMFSVPRRLGSGAGFTRLFVKQQHYQLRFWLVYRLLSYSYH